MVSIENLQYHMTISMSDRKMDGTDDLICIIKYCGFRIIVGNIYRLFEPFILYFFHEG